MDDYKAYLTFHIRNVSYKDGDLLIAKVIICQGRLSFSDERISQYMKTTLIRFHSRKMHKSYSAEQLTPHTLSFFYASVIRVFSCALTPTQLYVYVLCTYGNTCHALTKASFGW